MFNGGIYVSLQYIAETLNKAIYFPLTEHGQET
jgi:hypothetical protein